MQLAISVQSVEDLGLLHLPWSAPQLTAVEQETAQSIRTAVKRVVGKSVPERLYFGSEFCHYRLVDAEDLLRAYEASREAGYAFTFVTPYLPQSGLQRLASCLAALAERLKRDGVATVEVVVNDWGVLNHLKQHYPCYKPVLGRLLNKMIRDPRVTQHYNRSGAPVQANTALKQASFTQNAFRTFLREAGVQMIELDNTLQGIEWDLAEEDDLALAVHLGFGCVATGRTCLVGSLHVEEQDKFRGHIVCKQQCRRYTAEMVNRHPRISDLPQRVFQKGNSVFYQQTLEQIEAGVHFARANQACRLVYSPRIPV